MGYPITAIPVKQFFIFHLDLKHNHIVLCHLMS